MYKYSPEISIFKRFQEYLNFIARGKYEWKIQFDNVANLVKGRLRETINYVKKYPEEQR